MAAIEDMFGQRKRKGESWGETGRKNVGEDRMASNDEVGGSCDIPNRLCLVTVSLARGEIAIAFAGKSSRFSVPSPSLNRSGCMLCGCRALSVECVLALFCCGILITRTNCRG